MKNQSKRKPLTKEETKVKEKEIKKLKDLAKGSFDIICDNTDNLLNSVQAINTYSTVVDRLLARTDIRVKDLNTKELKESKAEATGIYNKLLKLFKDETVEDSKRIMEHMAGKIAEYKMMKDLDINLKDLELKGFNEKAKTETKK